LEEFELDFDKDLEKELFFDFYSLSISFSKVFSTGF
jgi:hypothetical protein